MLKSITFAMALVLFLPASFADTGNITSLGELTNLKQSKLDQIYSTAEPGAIPDGNSNGKAILFPGSILEAPATLAAAIIWQGKVFDVPEGSTQGTLVNKVFGFEAINADVFMGPSWFDGKPAIIIDYQQTSILVPFVRDEIREVGPGIYLGRAYIRSPLGHFLGLDFALDFNSNS